MQTTTICKEVHKGSQCLSFHEVVSILIGKKKHRLRITIRSDSYREQCYAKIKRWTGSTWSEVHHILDMQTKEKLCYRRPTPGEEAFRDDRNELLHVAERVLA